MAPPSTRGCGGGPAAAVASLLGHYGGLAAEASGCLKRRQRDTDPFDLRSRFVRACKQSFDIAFEEIQSGQKIGCWSWYFFPVPPWVVNGIERGSFQNKRWCLRDLWPNELRGDDAARAFLRFQADGVDLREKYMAMMGAVLGQLDRGVRPMKLVGPLDDPKLRACVRLFERVSRHGYDREVNALCSRLLRALNEAPDE